MTTPADHLRRWDNDHLWHPFTPMQTHCEENVPIIKSGDGFFLVDTEGNRFLDGISSLWCNVHGHAVPEIDEAIREQLDEISHTTLLGLASVPSIELARALVEITPTNLNKVFYSDSGATAVEIALKIAFQYHQQKVSPENRRTLFVCLEGAYHGDTVGAVSVGQIDLFHRIFSDLLFDTIRVPAPITFRVPAEHNTESYLAHCYNALEQTLIENKDHIAAFVIEPLVQGAAGILVHPEGYLKRVRELTNDLGILLIADEVAVGFGRTGTMFACEQEAVRPDILCVAKGLSGGYLPLAATLTTDKIYNAFLVKPHEQRTFFHGHTFTGNPLGCAAALASLKLFEEQDVLKNVNQTAKQIKDRLSILKAHPHVGEIRQKGLMIGIELVSEKENNTPYPVTSRIGHQVTLAARERNVILRPLGDVIVLMPAPAMPMELIDQLCDVVIASIQSVTDS